MQKNDRTIGVSLSVVSGTKTLTGPSVHSVFSLFRQMSNWWRLRRIDAQKHILYLYQEDKEEKPSYMELLILDKKLMVTLKAALDSGDEVDCQVESGHVKDWSSHPWCMG